MDTQTLIVVPLVAACAAYVLWSLLPRAGRRGLAAALQRLPLPARLARRLNKAASGGAGCHCESCPAQPALPAASRRPDAAAQVVVKLHRR